MSRSRRMISFVTLLPLLSLSQFSSAGFSTIYSSVGGSSSVNHYQQPLPQQSQENTWTQYPLDSQSSSTYLPQQPQPQQQIQYQLQEPLAPITTAGGLQLSPLPTQSIFKSQQPISFNFAGQNSFFYSPQDQALYKVTKINLNGANGVTAAAGEKGKLEYGPPPPPHTTTTTTTPEPETIIDLLPPTPPPAPTPPPSNLRPYYNTRPMYRINFTVFESSPNEPVRCGSGGGGGEGMNPALTATFGADAAPAGCPPVSPPAGGTPEFGVPVPVSEDPDSPSSSLSPSPSQSQFQVPGEVGVPSTSYGAPSKYGPPPPKYGAPAPTIRPDDGIAGTGTRGNTNGQTNGVSFVADGTIG